MFKSKTSGSVKENPEPQKSSKAEILTKLLKARLPAVFEREPAPAYAEGALKKLVEDILSL